MKPKLSVICTTFNVGPHMRETIDNIISQTYKDWEFLVMDGGSQDGTAEMVREYGAKDPRIQLFSEPDEGPLHAYEKGLARAAGDYLIFTCGQDIFCDPTWFAVAVDTLEKDKAISLVWAVGLGISEDGKLLGTNASYSHLIEGRGKMKSFAILVGKFFSVIKDIIFGGWERKKFLFRNFLSGTTSLRLRSISTLGFVDGKFPQKEDWFFYWLKTGLVFPDQSIVVSKKVYIDTAPRYELGSRRVNSFFDFVFNFNTKGYMAYFVPANVVRGRVHHGSSGERAARELYLESEKYFDKIPRFRDNNRGKTIAFRDRDGNVVSQRTIK